ncbi:MAG: STAS domain-containing protein [Terriglobia bacterium]
MKLAINTRESQGVTVLDLSGRVVLGEECNSLRKLVAELLAAAKTKILINLGDVAYVDSSGIGILVESVLLTAKQNGALKLVNMPRVLRNTLLIHRLLPVFEVYDNEAEALASFK